MCVVTMQEPQTQNQSLAEEKHSHAMALQALERQAKEDLLSERNRLQTLHHLELGNTHVHMGIGIARTHPHTCTAAHTHRASAHARGHADRYTHGD